MLASPAAPVTPAAPPAPALGTPEYDAAMAAKYDRQTEGAPAKPTPESVMAPAARPEGVPEKFWDAEKGQVNTEALLKSYSELEKSRGQKPQDPAPQVTQDPAGKPAGDEAAAAVAQAGLDMAALSAKVDEKGTLDDSDYEALAKVGIPKDYVDAYIEGQKALGEKFEAKVFDAAGGKDSFNSMQAWANANLSQGEIDAYNDAVNGTEAQAMLAVQGLRARFEAAAGKEPTLLGGQQGASQGAGYGSSAEMTRDMRDPRYATDPAFRAKVAEKIQNSSALNFSANVY